MMIKNFDKRHIQEEFAKAYLMHVDEQFETEGKHMLGKGWAPLSEKYKRPKGSTVRGKILQDTSRMRKSNDYRVEGDNIVFINNRKGKKDVPLALVHNRGALIRKIKDRIVNIKIPARPFFVWNARMIKYMLLELKNIIERGV